MIFRTITILLLMIFCSDLIAQVTSNNGRFTIPEEKACAPYGSNGEIVINVPECDGSLSCAVDFKYDPSQPFGTDPQGEDNVEVILDGIPVSYNYTEPGTYFIAILFGAGTGDIDYVPFTVLPNDPPDFNIYTCSNNAVQVDILDNTREEFTIDYDNDNVTDEISGSGFAANPFTYGAASTRATINVRPNYRNCVVNTKQAQLIPGNISASQVIERLQVTDGNQIELSLGNTQPDVLYQLDRGTTGPLSEVAKVTNTAIYTDLTAIPEQGYYCYRLGAVDVCNSPVPSYTNTICSIVPDLKIDDGSISISWTTNTANSNTLELFRNNFSLERGLAAEGTYIDEDVTCGTKYCYQFVMRYGNAQSVSKAVCGTAKSSATPLGVQEITTVVNESSVGLEWLPTPNYTISKYDVFKLPENYLPAATVTEPSYTDNFNTQDDNCYLVRFEDVCKNISSMSSEVCALALTANLDEAKNSVLLSWQPYTGYTSGVARYVIEKYDENGNKIAEFDVQGQTAYEDRSEGEGQAFTYLVKAYSNSPGLIKPSVSNVQSIIKSPRLWHPTAFIPEGNDVRNQTFSVKGNPEYISQFELRIFNRWGEEMFVSNDMNKGWDGRYKGVKMPEGTYIFRTKITDTAGRTFDYSGAVVLFRKQ